MKTLIIFLERLAAVQAVDPDIYDLLIILSMVSGFVSGVLTCAIIISIVR